MISWAVPFGWRLPSTSFVSWRRYYSDFLFATELEDRAIIISVSSSVREGDSLSTEVLFTVASKTVLYSFIPCFILQSRSLRLIHAGHPHWFYSTSKLSWSRMVTLLLALTAVESLLVTLALRASVSIFFIWRFGYLNPLRSKEHNNILKYPSPPHQHANPCHYWPPFILFLL